MNSDKIVTLLTGMAAINRLLAQETAGDAYFGAVVDRMSDTIIMGATGLASLQRAETDTEEFEALIVENGTDTREMPAVRLYDANGKAAS